VKTVPFVPDDIDLESELSIMNKVKYERVDNLVHVKAIYFFEDHSMPSRQQSRMGIVMRWFEDGSLRDRLVRTQHHKHSSESLSWGDKLQLALDVCNGLGKLHEMALLHRDVKSDNVLLKMENGRLKGEWFDRSCSSAASNALRRFPVRLRHLCVERERKCSQAERVRRMMLASCIILNTIIY
jgi:serine/threonine protein kinase